jgi:integrase
MTNNHVSGFIASQVGFQPKTMSGKVSCLRGLFQFLYIEGYISNPAAEALPKVQSAHRVSVPTVWKPEELQKAKESIDLGNPIGRRDYAIIKLASSTGIRGGDMINLKLADIDWEKKEISIIQGKTSTPLILPLMEDTGWALIDYIKNARPKSQYNNVFLSHLSPFEPFRSPSAFYTLLTKYLVKAGVKPGGKTKAGIHSLRHTLASELLQNNVEINTIADILGHTDPESTRNYLKVNIEALRRCTLEVVVDGE